MSQARINMTSFSRALAILLGFVFGTVAIAQPVDFEHANLAFYKDRTGNRKRITSVADWEIRRQQILEGAQLAMGALPSKRSRTLKVTRLAQQRLTTGTSIETIRLEVNAQSSVVADVYFPKGAENQEKHSLPAILALHPTGAPGKRIIGGESPRLNRQYANELAQRGYVVIAPDYPSFGDLKDHDFAKDGLDSGTMQGILNHMKCVDYLQSLPMVNQERIGVIGHSLGGHNAIFVAAFDQRLKAIVTSCGWTPFHDYYGGKLAGWTSDRYMPWLKSKYDLDPDKVPFDFYELIAALAPRPFYSNSPLLDSNFDVQGVKKAVPKIKQIYSLFDKEGLNAYERVQVAHPKCQHDFPSEIRLESYRFLDKALRHQPVQEIDFAGELPRIQPLSPQEALKSFKSAGGAPLRLVAHEPVVHDPIAMSFEDHQKLFVIEMKDYSEQDSEFLGRVRLLVDEDENGIFEKSTVFADKLSWPTAIICYDGGVFVGAAPDIWYLKDTDGDGMTDIRKKVFTGFGRGNVQGLMNSFRWGLDNRIHGATSSSGGRVYRVDDDPKNAIDLRGSDFSFDPRKLDIRRETGGAQHGMCFDDFGNKYVCSNSDHAQAILFDDGYLKNNPYFVGTRARKSIAVDGGQAPVFRDSPIEPWRLVRTRLRVAGRVPGPVEGGGTPAGYFTGSTGITIYLGNANALEKGTAIIGDVGSNIVHRKLIERLGLDVTATRIDKNSELISSSDIWFRPVQFGNAPDGCLYILDMYREVIEHPKSLPPAIKKHLDLTHGRERGRIYRLGLPKKNNPRHLDKMNSTDLVALLNHPNGWHREAAARMIQERQDITCVPALQTVRVQNFGPQGRLLALWALHGLKRLKLDDLMIATLDSDPNVRRHAILLAEKSNPDWLYDKSFHKLEKDPDITVRIQLAFSLGALPAKERDTILWRMLRRNAGHPILMTAIMSSANDLQLLFLKRVSQNESFLRSKVGQDVLNLLIGQLIRRNQHDETLQIPYIVQELIAAEKTDLALYLSKSIADINSRFKSMLVQADTLKPFFAEKFAQSQALAANREIESEKRIEAIRTLQLSQGSESASILLELVAIEQPLDVQLAAIETLGKIGDDQVAIKLISRRQQVGLEASELIRKWMTLRSDWTLLFLENSKPSEIGLATLQLLSRSSNKETSRRATALMSKETSFEIAATLKKYEASLNLLGDIQNGQKIFEKHCAKCHRAGGVGFEIGPNLAAMKSRGKAAILSNVLDPNREVNPAYLNYLVETFDGKTHNGMIAAETASTLSLKQEKNKRLDFAKTEIEAIKNTGLSLMPVGLEKEIKVEQMADLLEFLMNTK